MSDSYNAVERKGNTENRSTESEEISALKLKLFWLWVYIHDEGLEEEAMEYLEDHMNVGLPFKP